jgi:hypothetical protein
VSPAPYGRLPGRQQLRPTSQSNVGLSVPIATTYPAFITAGLITLVDAANPLSYPGTGTTWFDLSGNNRNFELQSSPTWSPTGGGYIEFSGSNQAKLSYDAGLNPTNWSVVIWVYLLTNPGTNDTIFARGYPPTIQYYLDCRGNFQFGAFSDTTPNNNASVQSTTSCNSTTGSWRMITGRYDGTNMAIFVDGAKETDAARSWGGYTSTAEFAIAALPLSGGYSRRTDMRCGLCAIYNRPLTDEEVRTNFQATRWRFGR